MVGHSRMVDISRPFVKTSRFRPVIRPAVPEDAPDLARVHVTSWQAAYVGMIDQGFLESLDVAARARWWEGALGRGSNLVNVAEEAGVIEGFCLAGPSSEEGWGEVYAIYVTPAHWGAGLGRGLLDAGEAALAGTGHERALLWVLAGNERARRFYERQGWVLGRPIRIENIGGSDVTEVRYEKWLGAPLPRRDRPDG
jgi:GNAT superfamily N-acetyltransferase